jgi:hypothetical protein
MYRSTPAKPLVDDQDRFRRKPEYSSEFVVEASTTYLLG